MVVSEYTEANVLELLQDAGIVRHRGKIEATINNAARALEMTDEFGSVGAFLWSHEPARGPAPVDIQPTTELSTALSKNLKKRGWRVVGPTTMYAFMQAMGLVNDHLGDCVIRDEVEAARSAFSPPALSTAD